MELYVHIGGFVYHIFNSCLDDFAVHGDLGGLAGENLDGRLEVSFG